MWVKAGLTALRPKPSHFGGVCYQRLGRCDENLPIFVIKRDDLENEGWHYFSLEKVNSFVYVIVKNVKSLEQLLFQQNPLIHHFLI
jgi:hypothetical protein